LFSSLDVLFKWHITRNATEWPFPLHKILNIDARILGTDNAVASFDID